MRKIESVLMAALLIVVSLVAFIGFRVTQLEAAPSDDKKKSITGYFSVPAAAFVPEYGGYDYENDGHLIRNFDGLSDTYVAPVHLPHGAIVEHITFYWYDASPTSDGSSSLWRNNNVWVLTEGFNLMSRVYSSGSSGNGNTSDNTISYATIDNSEFSYYLVWDLLDNNIAGYGVAIEYTLPK